MIFNIINICFYTYFYFSTKELRNLSNYQENKCDIITVNDRDLINSDHNKDKKDKDDDCDKEFELIISKPKNKGYQKLQNEDKEL